MSNQMSNTKELLVDFLVKIGHDEKDKNFPGKVNWLWNNGITLIIIGLRYTITEEKTDKVFLEVRPFIVELLTTLLNREPTITEIDYMFVNGVLPQIHFK